MQRNKQMILTCDNPEMQRNLFLTLNGASWDLYGNVTVRAK